jgi:hypothetical protein
MKHILSIATAGITLCFAPLFADNPQMSTEEENRVMESIQSALTQPGSVSFTPPAGWKIADPKALSPYVKIMVVGKGEKEFPPSINLAIDPFKGSLKEYLKIVKRYNDSQKAEWKDLGTIMTGAGEASLSQVDTKTKWGVEREMQLIFIRDGSAYILTAAALKDEFANHYNEFFAALKSVRINPEK